MESNSVFYTTYEHEQEKKKIERKKNEKKTPEKQYT